MNERIRELRKELGLTLEQFGEKVGVGRAAISNIENGNRNLTEQMIKSICREFGVNEDWLRNGEGEMFVSMEDDLLFAEWAGRMLSSKDTSFQKKFVKMLVNLSDEEWKILEKKIKELADE